MDVAQRHLTEYEHFKSRDGLHLSQLKAQVTVTFSAGSLSCGLRNR